MLFGGAHCRALLPIAPHGEEDDACCPAEAYAALGNADAASAEWLISTVAVESDLLKAAEQADHDAEGAAGRVAQMTARMPTTARRSAKTPSNGVRER